MSAVMNTVKPPRKRSHRGDELTAWVFVFPVVAGILLFNVYPIVFSLYISFTRWNLITPPTWVGLGNYVHLFTADPTFFLTLRNTLI